MAVANASLTTVLFTDLDGTCVHYDIHEFARVQEQPTDAALHPATSLDGAQQTLLLRLPPSTSGALDGGGKRYETALLALVDGPIHPLLTELLGRRPDMVYLCMFYAGAQGVISLETLRLYAALRQLGVKLVVVTGARTATLLARLPFIPAADAYVCEGGGRIFYPAAAGDLPTAAPLVEDLAWRQQQTAAGPPGQDGVPPEQRSGPLWRFYAQLTAAAPPGVKTDAASYTSAFRVKGPPEAVAAAVAELPDGLSTAVNLGAADVFPSTSGKENAARYLMDRFGAVPSDCAFMCDDDNDLALAALVRRAYLPGITADTVRHAVESNPERFYVAAAKGVFGAEEVLRLLLAERLAAAAPAKQ